MSGVAMVGGPPPWTGQSGLRLEAVQVRQFTQDEDAFWLEAPGLRRAIEWMAPQGPPGMRVILPDAVAVWKHLHKTLQRVTIVGAH